MAPCSVNVALHPDVSPRGRYHSASDVQQDCEESGQMSRFYASQEACDGGRCSCLPGRGDSPDLSGNTAHLGFRLSAPALPPPLQKAGPSSLYSGRPDRKRTLRASECQAAARASRVVLLLPC